MPPSEAEIVSLADNIGTFKERNEYELEAGAKSTELDRLRADLLLYQALLYKLTEMSDKLDKIESLSLTFHAVTPEDLSTVVQEATQMLEERRLLVLSVDAVDPDAVIDLVTVRVAG